MSEKEHSTFKGKAKEFTKDTAIGATLGGSIPLIAQGVTTAIGFSPSGVVAGSTAAGIQSGIGNVAAGSIFSTMQAVGATGALIAVVPIGLAVNFNEKPHLRDVMK